MSSDLFQNKYRISSARLQKWDYAKPGMYFITICTTNRECYFGKIIDKQMQLSELGKIAEAEWLKTIELRPDMNLQLGEFRVMPNHFHAIIIIGNNDYNGGHTNTIHGRDGMHPVSTITPTHRVETPCMASLRNSEYNLKICHLLFVGINLLLPPLPEKIIFRFNGSPGSMTIFSVQWMNTIKYLPIS